MPSAAPGRDDRRQEGATVLLTTQYLDEADSLADDIDPTDPVPVQVAGADAFGARAGELGAGDGDLVVTYDDYYGIFAARLAWAFRYYGAESRVLGGGWSTWKEEGRPVSDASDAPARRDRTPGRRRTSEFRASRRALPRRSC